MGGHVISLLVRDQLQRWLYSVRASCVSSFRNERKREGADCDSRTPSQSTYCQSHLHLSLFQCFRCVLCFTCVCVHAVDFVKKVMGAVASIGNRVEYFLSTGNLRLEGDSDMQQQTGYCIIAERLNFLRFLSHLRCIHRGSFFAEMKTTEVRKLMPESWGFLCPIHSTTLPHSSSYHTFTHTYSRNILLDTF